MATLEERLAAKRAEKGTAKAATPAAPSLEERLAAKRAAKATGQGSKLSTLTAPEAADPDSFGSSIGRAVDNMQSNFGGTAEAIGELTGAEGLAEWGGEYRDEQKAEAAAYGLPSIGSYKDVDSWGDAYDFGTETLTSSIPGLGAVFGGGAAAAKMAPMALKPAAAVTGALATSLGINIGDVQNQIKEIDPEAKSTIGSVLAGGAISLLDVAGAGAIAKPLLKTLGKDVTEELLIANGVKKSVVKEALKGAAIGGTAEAATGATQSVIGNVAAAKATDTEVNAERVWENAVNAAIGGGLVGGAAGATAGGISASKNNTLLPDTAIDQKAFEDGDKTPQGQAGRMWAALGDSSTKMIEPMARVSTEAKKLLRDFRPDMTGREATGTTIFEDSRLMAGKWRTRLEEVRDEVGGVGNFNKLLDDYMNNGKPTTPEAQKFKDMIEEIHQFAKTEGRLKDIGKIERFLPISADPEIVKARYDEFLQDILPTYGNDATKARAAIDTWLEKTEKRPENEVPNIHRLVDVDAATGELTISDKARFDKNDPDTMKFKFSQGQIPPENTHLEKTRTFGKVPQATLAKYAKEQSSKDRYNAVSDYIESAAHRLAFTKRYGPRGERANAMIAKAVKQAQAAGYRPSKAEVTRMFDMLDAYNGMLGNLHRRRDKIAMSTAATFLTLKTLPLAGLSTLVETMTPAIRGTVSDAIVAAAPALGEMSRNLVRTMFKGVPKSEWATMASEAGITLSAATNIAAQRVGQSFITRGNAKLTTAFFLANGLSVLTHMTRVYAAKTGDRIYAKNLHVLASGVPLTSARAQKSLSMLRSMGVDIQSTQQAKSLYAPRTASEVQTARQQRVAAMHRFATQAVLEPTSADVPMWMSDQKYQLVAMLHRYPSAFTNTILPQLYRRATPGWAGGQLGASTAAVGSLFLIGMMVSIGYVQDELKQIMKNGEVDWEDTRTDAQRFNDVLNQTIMPVQASWIADFFNAPRYGSSGLGSIGPAVGFVEEFGKTIYNIANNPSEGKIYQWLYKQTPAQFFRPGREAASEVDIFD